MFQVIVPWSHDDQAKMVGEGSRAKVDRFFFWFEKGMATRFVDVTYIIISDDDGSVELHRIMRTKVTWLG